MSIRIGLDLLNLRNLQDGVGRFSRQLVTGLSSMDRENKYLLFARREVAEELEVKGSNFEKICVDLPGGRLLPWNQAYFALHSLSLPKMDILHAPVSVSPLYLARHRPTLVTVHDLAFKRYPETCSKRSLRWWNYAWPACLKRVEHVVADSESTKGDLRRYYGVPESRISVIYPYVSFGASPQDGEALSTVRDRYRIPERYLLFVGAPHRRKNLGTLFRAFRILKDELKVPQGLVLVGPSGWAIKDLLEEIRALRLGEDVVLTGFVPDREMSMIYRSADVFVFPSLYEGFGYPPLEAMACGVPVVMSRASSLPEVGGDAVLYVDPRDPADIAEKVGRILRDPQLSKRLSIAGCDRSADFSMAQTIRGYLDVYERVIKSSSRA
jgi:glycosyltransferase involved in cell wall biosynthesis